jgi:hypothetical protein
MFTMFTVVAAASDGHAGAGRGFECVKVKGGGHAAEAGGRNPICIQQSVASGAGGIQRI